MKLDIYIISEFGLYTARTREATALQSSAGQQIGIIYEKKCNISFSYFQLNWIESKAVQIHPGKERHRLGFRKPWNETFHVFYSFFCVIRGFFTPVENANKAKKPKQNTRNWEMELLLNVLWKYLASLAQSICN